MRLLSSQWKLVVSSFLFLPIFLNACATSKSQDPMEAAVAEEVDAIVSDSNLDTPDAEVKDYTVTEYQSFNPNGIVVHFEFEKADLTPKARAALDKIVKGMKKDPLARITIRGHADKQGPEKYNENLSAKRAKVIKNYLTSHGIEAERLDPESYGARDPVEDANRVSAYKKNRRGDFNINYGPSAFGPAP